MTLSATDISALRSAHRLTIRSIDASASITIYQGALATLVRLASQPIPFVSTDPTNRELTVRPISNLGASPVRGGRKHEAHIRRVHRTRDWAEFTNGLQEGDDIQVRWERDGYALLLVQTRNTAHGLTDVGRVTWNCEGSALLVSDLRNGRSVGFARRHDPGPRRRRWHRNTADQPRSA